MAFSQQVLPPDDDVFHYYQSDTLDNDLKSLRKSFYGNRIAPEGEFRILNLFINIIYDQTGHFDPIQNPNEVWSPDTIEGINRPTGTPNCLEQFMDVEYLPAGGFGSMTRLYRESSFDNLILLSETVQLCMNTLSCPIIFTQS